MLSKIYGIIAFLCLILAPGAVEGGMYITACVMIVAVWVFANLSMREEQRRKSRWSTRR